MSLEASELILNEDGSIYHLNLFPEDLADTVITVGDPERVAEVSKRFDSVRLKKQKREFTIHTGELSGKEITVMSTGMGTDNIDIAFNELDALKNIDFNSRTIKKKLKSMDIIRIGTTGSVQENIPVDSFLISELAMGFDTLLRYYDSEAFLEEQISTAFVQETNWDLNKGKPYVVKADSGLINKMNSEKTILGFTATNVGFYGPQSRKLRLDLSSNKMNDKLANFSFEGKKITNLEMETSGIYGLSKLLGHRAVSMNLVLANRANGTFTKNPTQKMNELIDYCLQQITSK